MIKCDLLVLGGGIAGCSAALRAAELGADVVVVLKDPLGISNTRFTELASVVSDGLIVQYSVSFGPGIRRSCWRPTSRRPARASACPRRSPSWRSRGRACAGTSCGRPSATG